MDMKHEPEPVSPTNNDTDGEDQEEIEDIKPPATDVANILKRLQSSGALIKKPKQEYRCFTCVEDFINWAELEQHLIQHVSLPSIILNKLPDDYDAPDDDWSDDDDIPSPPKIGQKTPQKIDISEILNKTGLSIKSPSPNTKVDPTLNKLCGLGFTIKKNTTPIKSEKVESETYVNKDVMQKLGQLGGIKLKLKSDGNNANTFKVVNGLKDFKASDDEDENEMNNKEPSESDDELDGRPDISEGEIDSEGEQEDNNKTSENKNSNILINKKIADIAQNLGQPKLIPAKQVVITPTKLPVVTHSPAKEVASLAKPRSNIKQTPKRTAVLSIQSKEISQPTQEKEKTTVPITAGCISEKSDTEVVVKQEVTTDENNTVSDAPLFSGEIKTERFSPSLNEVAPSPVISAIKSEPDPTPGSSQPLFQNNNSQPIQRTSELLPVTKTEEQITTVIEINGDSNDEDDDCCVVSATPAPDIKPIIPKSENPPTAYVAPVSYSTAHSSFNLPPVSSSEKQHNFDWNAPDSKPAIDIFEKSADDIFESLLSDKKDNNLSEASEYISLDTLGPHQSCEVCNTRFTSKGLLEEHKRVTGHSMSLVTPASSMLPYSPSSNILQSLLPMKQLAEQVGKLSNIGGLGPGITPQQNVMINIQAYPPYNSYPSGQNIHPSYPPNSGMFNVSGQNVPGQYPGPSYLGPGMPCGQQFPTSMPSSNYPGNIPQTSYPPSSSPYSTASSHPRMQQPIYGQTLGQPQMPSMAPMASMASGVSSSHSYIPTTSPSGLMKPPTSTASGIKIQNVQMFVPGQLIGTPGQSNVPGAPGQVGPQLPPPGAIKMAAGANMAGPRPRMQIARGSRPSIRAGLQVQGQIRGSKPGIRMPIKRPAMSNAGPGQKRRSDMLLPGKHDNEDCHVMAMQKQRDGLPMIHSVQGARDKLNIGSQISVTKKPVNKEANAMANVLASRGISVKQKQKSRSPTPERPVPHIPNLGAGVSIKHTSKSSNFSIPESTIGGAMLSCKICKKMFMNHNSLSVHMSNAHPQSKYPVFKCDECPASYPKSLQLQHHKRVFHNVSGPNRELGLPVIDISQEENVKRLSNLGIYSFIPLANREQSNGCFGIPVISVHNMHNGITHSLRSLGADGLLSLGPMKPLPNS